MILDPTIPAPPPWPEALFSLLHPVQIALVDAFFRIDEPMSVTLPFDVLARTIPFGTVSYYVGRPAEAGVLVLR
jgi:hypothetical protein